MVSVAAHGLSEFSSSRLPVPVVGWIPTPGTKPSKCQAGDMCDK